MTMMSVARRSLIVILGVGLAVNQLARTPFTALDSVNLDSPVNCDLEYEYSESADPIRSLATDVDDTTTNLPIRPSNCKAVVRRMQEWSDCWRRHLVWMKNQPNGGQLQSEKLLCPIKDETDPTNPHKLEVVGAPMYHFAYYKGQGFGRVVAHSVEACLTAFLLGRPCIINVGPRDPNFTWRSFIDAQSYQWDPALLHALPDYAEQLEGLAQKLPHLGANEWGPKTLNASQYDTDQSLIFPMNKIYTKENWASTLQYYHATNTTNSRRGEQILFSPNWANAWFTKIPTAKIFPQEYHCKYEVLKTHMQNAMYGPTDLALQRHQTRYQTAVTSGSWDISAKKISKAEPKESLIMPHLTTDTVNKDQDYGSIHLRLHFLNERRETPIKRLELVTMVRRCLQDAKDAIPDQAFPKNWFLLADNSTMAVEVAEGIQARQQTQLEKSNPSPLFDPSIPIVNLYHDYRNVTKKSSKELSSQHSNGAAAKGMFAHATMAGAIGDWMALHSSTVAIVVHVGSFGTTGARGNGKSPRAFCGTKKGAPHDHMQPFQIFV